MPKIGMNFFIFATIVAIFLTLQWTVTEAEEEFKWNLAECKKVMSRIMKRSLKALGQCSRELKRNVTGSGELFEKKMGCIIKCTLKRMDLINDKGIVTRNKIQKFINEMVPTEAHGVIHALAQDCDQSHAEKLDATQENCESYSNYAICMQTTVSDWSEKTLCHPELPH